MTAQFPANQAIVVGGGLAGFSAAHTIIEHGGRVLLIDKMPICGGNSSKATSGINGANTRTQRQNGVEDSVELFVADTLRGGAKREDVAKAMCVESGPSVEWLMDRFGLDLSKISQLGGHSVKRTHRGKDRFPGMTITFALMEAFEKLCELKDGRAVMYNRARAVALLTDSDKKNVIGVEYEREGKKIKAYGPVVLATGGFGADFGPDSLLAKYRSDLIDFPTTNADHATGDGIKLGEAIGARAIDLNWVQVHPTGLVNMSDPDSRVKFLAAEALRGVGGILIDANGKRFANELGRRDYVTGEMWKNKPPFRLILNSKSAKEIEWHCEHYCGRGVMKKYPKLSALAADSGIPMEVLTKTFADHNELAVKTEKDPEGGPYPAYPTGKSWDKFGKKFYQNMPSSMNDDEVLNVAIVTPVVHYCMGGLEINPDAEVSSELHKGAIIGGLYAAGEVAGGVHGTNRLGGNSLLDCVVFGRLAGRSCAKFMFGADGHFRTCPKVANVFTPGCA